MVLLTGAAKKHADTATECTCCDNSGNYLSIHEPGSSVCTLSMPLSKTSQQVAVPGLVELFFFWLLSVKGWPKESATSDDTTTEGKAAAPLNVRRPTVEITHDFPQPLSPSGVDRLEARLHKQSQGVGSTNRQTSPTFDGLRDLTNLPSPCPNPPALSVCPALIMHERQTHWLLRDALHFAGQSHDSRDEGVPITVTTPRPHFECSVHVALHCPPPPIRCLTQWVGACSERTCVHIR